MNQVTEQKGIASSTPSPLKRFILSRLMTHVISETHQEKHRTKAESKRRKKNARHVIEYFHQIDDGYSHLAIQILERLTAKYDVELVVHLVPALRDANFPEPDLLQEMSRTDAAQIAPYYSLSFPQAAALPSPHMSALATGILCQLNHAQFANLGVAVSEALWRADEAALTELAQQYGTAWQSDVTETLKNGAERRAKLKHYAGAMFYYAGEWYWGVDRLYHLEQRLKSLGAAKAGDYAWIAPRPDIPVQFPQGAKGMTLEYFPSLRSPYTAMSWDATHRLVRNSGINLVMRPVLPMVMRGVPATLEKGFYIFKDAAREARAIGNCEFGTFFDPIGEPVKQGYSLYMWAKTQGKGIAFYGSFLKAAFNHGVNMTKPAGLQRAVEMAGLNWTEAQQHLNDDTWAEVLEDNRLAMYRFGSWGVPSYRLLDRDGKELLGVWGQDRLWLVAQKIKELS